MTRLPPALLPFLLLLVLPSAGCGGASSSETRADTASAHGGGHHGAHGPLVHRFEDAAAWAREFDDPARDAWQKPEEVVALMAIGPGATVADLGAGTGYFMKYLSRAVGADGQVLALDIEESMVRFMRDRAAHEGLTNVAPRVVPFDDPGLAAGSVDRVLIVDTWHHIPDREVYGRKLATALRPEGSVFVVDFTAESAHGPPAHARIPPAQVVRELEAAGLHAEILPEDLPDQYVVRASR